MLPLLHVELVRVDSIVTALYALTNEENTLEATVLIRTINHGGQLKIISGRHLEAFANIIFITDLKILARPKQINVMENQSSKPTILAVDDNEDFLWTLKQLIGAMGCELAVCTSVTEGLAR